MGHYLSGKAKRAVDYAWYDRKKSRFKEDKR